MARGARILIATFALGAAAASAAPAAEIALVLSSDVPAWRSVSDALRAAAAGHTVTTHDLHGSRAEADKVFLGLKDTAAVVVAVGPLAAQAAREIAAELPLVYCMVHDPSSVTGLNASNVTGVAFSVPMRNQLVAFRAVNPKAARIGVVYSMGALKPQLDDARRAASALRLDLVLRQVSSMQAVPQALRELLSGPEAVDALWIPTDPLVLVVGAEGAGLSRLVRDTCDQVAGIPISSTTESLNASVAAGIALYSLAQRRAR